jgi:hypothetical protein
MLTGAGRLSLSRTNTHADIGTSSATKLLARKRPRLCPISDSVVIKAVGVPGRTLDVLRCLMQDPAARAQIEALRPAVAAGPPCCASWTLPCGYLTANPQQPTGYASKPG